MYQVLYRKYRPKVFADVVGQPQVTVTLRNELQAGRIAHAYLFTGSRGTGKTTCAKILAKAVNCLHPVEGDPCGDCEICRGIDSGAVMDVVEIDAASNNGVENIRNLREEASFTPAAARYRVYIIDEVHMLSIGAFNALLKTLEEPPAHVIFILATTEVHKLPATILSRCQRFDFKRIASEDIADRLSDVAKREGAALEREAALLIARLADGALRDALSLLDQCMGRSREVTQAVVTETAGLASREHLYELAQAALEQRPAQALEVINQLHEASKDMVRLCEELISHFRSMMLLKTIKDARDLIVLPAEEYARLEEQAARFSLPEILHVMNTLQDAMERMFRGGDRRTEMEMTAIKICSPELDSSPDAILRRLDKLERMLRAGGVPASENQQRQEHGAVAPSSSPPVRGALPAQQGASAAVEQTVGPEENAAPSEAGKEEKEPARTPPDAQQLLQQAQPFSSWPEVLQVLKGYSQVIASAFNGSAAYVSGDFVLIDAPNSMAFELLRKSAQRDKMRIAIKEVTGRTYKLGPYRTQTKAAQEDKDPLEELAKLAQQEGIEVTKE
ncbi:MAG TPA: DNA polymerase III subunit gamma/tau [Candidatus Gallacutalibacter stercoravium]|nr:DNA polymerase III subunit gamma/tau [Candidatus Gallacutalibacter stercoravium]